jgi:AbrB family looped-hinge helix DNA binding protein
MRITTKGQVTIPQWIREQTGLLPNTDVDFEIDGDGVRIRKSRGGRRVSRGSAAVTRLRGRARGAGMSTDEILALTRAEP